MNDFYTENMADIMSCSRERELVKDLINAWDEQGLPENFDEDNVRFAFNKNSGHVFLVNDNCDVAMMNGDKLESWYSTPCSGYEGFLDELLEQADDSWDVDDLEYLADLFEKKPQKLKKLLKALA